MEGKNTELVMRFRASPIPYFYLIMLLSFAVNREFA